MTPVTTYTSGTPVEEFLTGSGTVINPQQQTVVVRLTGAGVAGSFSETAATRDAFVADANYQVVAVTERHSVVGSTTVQLVKALGSTPVGSGANVLSTALDLTSTVNVYNSAVILQSSTLNTLAVGDGLGLRWTTPNALPPSGVINITLQRI